MFLVGCSLHAHIYIFIYNDGHFVSIVLILYYDLCNYCGKEREDVQNEMRFKDHTCRNKNEVFCSTCEKCFGSGLILRRHIKSVHNGMEYKCNECEAIFTTMDAMKRHEKGHQIIKEQKCDICNKEFSRK